MKRNIRAVMAPVLMMCAGFVVVHASTQSLPKPVTDAEFYDDGAPLEEKVELGRLLFFDKIISGNKNIACATCHHPTLGSADRVALPLGEGPSGLGPDRKPGEDIQTAVHGRVPRNSPAVFNVGAREFERLFHDGRVETDPNGYYEGGFITPAKWKLPKGLDNVLAAQAMFPVTSHLEMAGQKGENPIADAASLNNAAGAGGVWEQIAERLQGIPEYVELFKRAYPDEVKEAGNITYIMAANAIAAFEAKEFRADNSPFDKYITGDSNALSEAQLRGMEVFYGKANCVSCHSGKFQTDHDFHAIAMPQIGPGKADGRHGEYWNKTGHSAFLEDFGRGRVTVRREDAYKFRTPSLRNTALTGPWGHAGAFGTLEAVVRHHLDPVASLNDYSSTGEDLPPLGNVVEVTASGSKLEQQYLSEGRQEGFLKRDLWVQGNDELRKSIAEANELAPIDLSDAEVADLISFLHSLTDTTKDLASLVPERVPSGLPVDD